MIVPRENMVVIRPDKLAAVSELIVLTENTAAKPRPMGQVVAIGPGVEEVQVGDTVHFETFDWTPAPDDCIIIEESEILAVESRQTKGVEDFKDYING